MITLYKIDTKGKIRELTVEVKGDSYRTIHGEKGGSLVETEWTKCIGKNIGKKNETTPEEQAQLEAEAIVKKKREKGYGETPEKKTGEVMLAKDYNDYKTKIKFPLFSQPKLDGIRCYVTKDGMFTRNHKEIVSCPHILEKLKSLKLFNNWPDLRLDGELYNPTLKEDFNKICSSVKKLKPTQEDLEESKKVIQYWIYDVVIPDLTFSERTAWLNHEIEEDDSIKVLETTFVENSKELDKLYEKYMEDGNEGQIVRLDALYEEKRSKNLLKRKEFDNDEYEILDIEEGVGNRSGKAGFMWFKNPKSPTNEPFKANIKGSWEFLKECLDNKDKLIGKMATIKFFGLTPIENKPRFGYVIAIRDYE